MSVEPVTTPRTTAQVDAGPGGLVATGSSEARAFVGVGGNLGDRLETLRSAVRALEHDVPSTRVVGASSIYETRPVGPSSEPFLNAVVELRTRLEPRRLLEALLGIEAQHGRERREKWGARTLDLDLLVVERGAGEGWVARMEDSEALTLPHPRMGGRDFVLVPLQEVAGDELEVGGRTVRGWLERVPEEERTVLRRLEAGLRGGGPGER